MRYLTMVLVGCLFSTVGRAANVVFEGTFADPAAGQEWSIVDGEPGSRLSVDPADGRDEPGALVIENASATKPLVVRHSQRIPADANAVLYVEGYGRIRSPRAESIGGDLALQVAWFDAADQVIAQGKRGVAFSKSDMTGWCRLAAGWVHAPHAPPENAAYAQIEIVCQPPGGPVVIDDIRVEATPADELRAWFGRPAISLNGKWQMSLQPWDVSETDLPAADKTWQTFYIPGFPARDRSAQAAWFRRTFEVPESFASPRIVLHLERIHTKSIIYINGKRIGENLGGDLPFAVDVTDALQRGGSNEIMLLVKNWRVAFDPPVTPEQADIAFARPFPIDSPQLRLNHSAHWDWDNMGVPGDVVLLGSGRQRVETVYARTTLGPTRLAVNGEAADANGLIASCDVLDGENVVLSLPDVKVASNTFQAAADAPDLALWWPDAPKLYVLRTQLLDASGKVVDEHRERFGLRTTEARGDVMVLNGVPMRFRNSSNWFPLYRLHDPYSRRDLVKCYQWMKSLNLTSHRAHATSHPRVVYQAADEAGMLMIAEAPTPLDHLWEKEGYYDNYYDAWVKMTRNNPSVFLRSVMNEYFSEHHRTEWYEKLRKPVTKLIRNVRELQPDMPLTFESDLDVYDMMDVLGLHYPDGYPRQQNWPEDLYWTGKTKHVVTPCFVNGQFRWDRTKPLHIGEFGWQNWNTPDFDSMLLGDAAYQENFSAELGEAIGGIHDVARALSWFGFIEAYRNQGVTGIGSWSFFQNGDLADSHPLVIVTKQAYAPIVAFQREPFVSGFGGAKIKRTLMVHNDTFAPATLTVRWQHQVAPQWTVPDPSDNVAFANADAWRSFSTMEDQADAKLAWDTHAQGEARHTLAPAQIQKMPIEIALPDVERRLRGRLKIEVVHEDQVVWTGYRPLDVWPKRAAQLPSSGVALYDPRGTTGNALRQVGVRAAPAGKVSSALRGARVLVIGRDAVGDALTQDKQDLAQWVSDGGRVVCLEQTGWADWLPFEMPKPEGNAISIAHIRAPGHPMLATFATTDLRFWAPDNVVARCIVAKPPSGAFRTLVDITSGNGMSYSAAIEVPWGKGAYIFNLLALADRAGADPVAAAMLRETIRYAASDAPGARSQVVIRASDRSLKSRLASRSGIKVDDFKEINATGDIDALRSAISDGATLYLHDLKSDDDLRFLGSLAGSEATWIEPETLAEGRIPSPMHVVGNSPITWGISSQELYWTDRAAGSWIKPPLANKQRGVSIAGSEARTLVSGGLLVELPLGNGRIVIDQVPWNAPSGNDEQATRYVSTLMTNLRSGTSGE